MRAWLRVALLLVAVAWGTNHFAPLLLVYRERLALTPVELGILFGVYALGLVPGLLLGGPLSDRRGRPAVVLPSALLALLGTFILAFGAHGFAVLLAGRLVVGLGSGATFGAGTAWVQDLAGDEAPGTGARRAAIALSSGFGGGPLVASVLAQWLPAPMVTPYAVQASVLIAALALAAQRTEGGAARTGTKVPGGPEEAPLRALPAGFFREVVPVAPWVFAFPSIAFAVLPALVREHVARAPVAYAGLVTATTLLSGVLAQPLFRTWTPRRAARSGLASGAVGLLVGLLAAQRGSALGVLGASLLLGAGYGGCLIAGLRWVEAAAAPAVRGQVTGVFYVFTYLGFAAPLGLAAVARHVGDAPGLLAAAALALGTALLA